MTTTTTNTIQKGFEIELSEVKVRQATAVLDESDFTSQEEIENGSIVSPDEEDLRQFIGLKLTVITQFSMKVKKEIMALQAVSQLKDPAEILKAFDRYSGAMASLIVSWNVTSKHQPLQINPETMDALPEPLQMAVFQVFNKALEVGGGLEKN